MTFQNEFTVTIDIKKNLATVNSIPTYVQNDTAILKVKIYNEGQPYDYSTADRYVVNFKRPDGVIVTGSGTYEVATGLIKYTLGSTEMEKVGMVETAISLFLGDTRITTKSFKIKVLEDYEHGIPSQEGYSLLQELFIEVEQVKTSIQDAAQYATDQGNWAKNIRDNFGHKGNYSPATVYKNGNVVSYGGINYMCIQDTTAGIDPLNGSYWSVVSPQATINQKTWTATPNQTVFTITNGSYVVGQGNIELLVGGVPQVSGQGYTETNGTTITLSEGVPVGTTVFAKWFEGTMTITKGHKTGHELGGQDELDVTKLKNFKEQVTDNFTSVNASLAEKATDHEVKKAKNPVTPLLSKKPNPLQPLYIETYDGANQAIHPKVLYFKDGWNGYKYWMAYTPYADYNEAIENPCIAVSHDGENWFTPSGLTNPLDSTPDVTVRHLSDTHLVYRPDLNRLECWYREAVRPSNLEEIIYRRTTTDGINWTPRERLYSELGSNTNLLSPAIIFENNLYKMWAVGDVANNRVIKYYESPNGTNWTAIRNISLDITTHKISHFDVIHTEKGYEFIGNTINNTTGKLDGLIYSISIDNITYSTPITVLECGNSGSWDSERLYRPALTYINGVYLLYYSATLGQDWATGLIKVDGDLQNLKAGLVSEFLNLPSNHTPESLPSGLSITLIKFTHATGYPEESGGLLTSYSNDNSLYTFEEFYVFASAKKYRRTALTTGTWSVWRFVSDAISYGNLSLLDGLVLMSNYSNSVSKDAGAVTLNIGLQKSGTADDITITSSGYKIATIETNFAPALSVMNLCVVNKTDNTYVTVLMRIGNDGGIYLYPLTATSVVCRSIRGSISYNI